ncbi:hypothetical protein, partial [Klebsiella pneumoniae]|uniref:hypothetical protein n=1 Tax=Klebsiella pneumoniae TaxID=573 RepID=UPI0038D3E30D
TNIMVGYRQTNQKTDTGKTLTRWPVFVDHFMEDQRDVALLQLSLFLALCTVPLMKHLTVI